MSSKVDLESLTKIIKGLEFSLIEINEVAKLSKSQIEFLVGSNDFKITQAGIPYKLIKPKHKQPFWTNNWRK